METITLLFEQPYMPVPPPLYAAINLLKSATSRRDYYCSMKAVAGLSVLEKICQPLCPSLYLKKQYGEVSSRIDIKDYFQPITDDKEKAVESSAKIHILSNVVVHPPLKTFASESHNAARQSEETVRKNTDDNKEVDNILLHEEDISKNQNTNDNKEVENSSLHEEDMSKNQSTDDDNKVTNISLHEEDISNNETSLMPSKEEVNEVFEEGTIISELSSDLFTQNVNGDEKLGVIKPSILDISEEPPSKKLKNGEGNDSEESMLDSFVDVINET